jgi:hypothetical protein
MRDDADAVFFDAVIAPLIAMLAHDCLPPAVLAMPVLMLPFCR